MNPSTQPKIREIKRDWHFISARGMILGRIATQIARLLMGKHKRTYAPNLDAGDWVVVTNARDVVLSGKKSKQKMYKRYSGYPGGLKIIPFSRMINEHPERVIEHAISGMLPDNRLKKNRLARLKVFAGSEHPYENKLKAKSEKGKAE